MSLLTSGYTGAVRNRLAYLGKVNGGWGVCGFTNAVYARDAKRPAERATLINTIYEYIHRYIAEAEVTTGFSNDHKYGLAMTPSGVARFLEMWGFRAKVIRMKDALLPDFGGNAIVGVRSKALDPSMPRNDGFRHWLYRHGGKYYSLGREFNSLQEAGAHVGRKYKVCWLIEIHEPRAPRI
jgi:hypothetical protein